MLVVGIVGATRAADDLANLRAERRQAIREQALAKVDGGAAFGLLVIPIDFRDQRFAAPPDLADRLVDGSPGSLAHYVQVASGGRTSLRIHLTPTVSLAGDRRDYSDRDLQGFTRTRAMAGEALRGAVATGLDLATSDADGDGEVDGVLLLHAAPGLENDPDGAIVPLQYFLEDPVVHDGITARMYAVGSARSGLGLWAHEVFHLLGLEDRYDLLLPAADEATPRGGLGRFSLMASGWRGSGDGHDPALPDAYSRLQLGWVDLATDLDGGVVRLVDRGDPRNHILIERRDGAATAPYDAGLGADQALAYRIREAIGEGEVQFDGAERRLRVQLIEADGDLDVALGVSGGELDDLFPSAGHQQRLDHTTVPSSRFAPGVDSGIAVRFLVHDGVVRLEDLAPRQVVRVGLIFPPDGASGEVSVLARLAPMAAPPARLTVEVAARSEAWGHFEDGGQATTIDLVATGLTGWQGYAADEPVRWVRTADVPAGARTTFAISAPGTATDLQLLDYPWDRAHAPLALDDAWLDHWQRGGQVDTHPWRRWATVPGWPEGIAPVAYCVAGPTTPEPAWPDVSYGNDAFSTMTSPPLGLDIRWVSITHALDVEMLRPGVSVDAATLVWHGPEGRVPARPVDGWPGRCDRRAGHPLAGTDGLVAEDTLQAGATPIWRTDVLPVPDVSTHGPGPWRLGVEFASSPLWRGRGWLLRDLVGATEPPPGSAFAVWQDGGALRWTAPVGRDPEAYVVEVRQGDAGPWRVVRELPAVATTIPLADLGVRPGDAAHVRVLARQGHLISSRALLVSGRAGTAALLAARPNPARHGMVVAHDGDGDPRARVAAHDLRGRRVRTWAVGGQAGRLMWDGTDDAGRRLASGVYILRLQANGRTRTTKVTWLP